MSGFTSSFSKQPSDTKASSVAVAPGYSLHGHYFIISLSLLLISCSRQGRGSADRTGLTSAVSRQDQAGRAWLRIPEFRPAPPSCQQNSNSENRRLAWNLLSSPLLADGAQQQSHKARLTRPGPGPPLSGFPVLQQSCARSS